MKQEDKPEPGLYAPLRGCCSFNCEQGRRCPAREACWLPESEREAGDWIAAFKEVAIVIFIVACAAVAAALIF